MDGNLVTSRRSPSINYAPARTEVRQADFRRPAEGRTKKSAGPVGKKRLRRLDQVTEEEADEGEDQVMTPVKPTTYVDKTRQTPIASYYKQPAQQQQQ